jgi:hypothetical protein
MHALKIRIKVYFFKFLNEVCSNEIECINKLYKRKVKVLRMI